ncbi:hypothetical protein AMTR_s00100p00079390 [Amborella trichopoda]|uniref:Uncharacterized protein n=1 Tax=Amborella trichopoda TaxID=13333 RepID=W1P0F3_AMBTC|nr:hypothetical protein AMTR_s00100p00079390 [Amborella trichopoda]
MPSPEALQRAKRGRAREQERETFAELCLVQSSRVLQMGREGEQERGDPLQRHSRGAGERDVRRASRGRDGGD